MFSKLGKALRFIGDKAASGAQWLGNKVGTALTAAAPVAAAFNPTLGAGVASAAAVAHGVGALGGLARGALATGNYDPGQLKGVVGAIQGNAAAVKGAYNTGARALRSALEKNI